MRAAPASVFLKTLKTLKTLMKKFSEFVIAPQYFKINVYSKTFTLINI